jgi:hypothetical protein
MNKQTRERFWDKVRVDRESGCWVWTAAISTWKKEPWDGGYGAFKLNGRVVRAHIVAYKILFGAIPRGKVLLHGCDNRRCVNVLEHVKPGTQIQNVRDMLAKGRSNHQRRKVNGCIGTESQGRSPDRCRA